MCICTCTQHVHTCTFAYTHVCMHPHAHSHIDTCIHTDVQIRSNSVTLLNHSKMDWRMRSTSLSEWNPLSEDCNRKPYQTPPLNPHGHLWSCELQCPQQRPRWQGSMQTGVWPSPWQMNPKEGAEAVWSLLPSFPSHYPLRFIPLLWEACGGKQMLLF